MKEKPFLSPKSDDPSFEQSVRKFSDPSSQKSSGLLNFWSGYGGPIWLALFFLLPLLYVVIMSFLTKGTYGGLEWKISWVAFEKLGKPQYVMILGRTLALAFFTAFLCTCLGAWAAWFIVSRNEKWRHFWLVLLTLPFLINSLIRLYSLKSFVGLEGPLQNLIRVMRPEFGTLDWTQGSFLMALGLIITYVPFAIFPLVSAFEKWDCQYFEAALDLGASFLKSFFSVVLPLISPQLLMTFFIVFIPSLGEYLVPEILGGSQQLYWAQLMTEAFLKWRDWPFGAALGLVLMILVLLIFQVNSVLKKRNQS